MADEEPGRAYFEEYCRLISTQAALLAGFAFAGLTAVSYDPTTSARLQTAFAVSASLAMVLEIVALFAASLLILLPGFSRGLELSRVEAETNLAWFSHLAGAFALLVSVALLAWVKVPPAAWPVTIIAGLASVAMLVILIRLGRKVHSDT